MKIKQSDLGKTKILKNFLSKDSFVFEVLGNIDELICWFGFFKNIIKDKKLKKVFLEIQKELFIVQAKISSIFLLKQKSKNLPSLNQAIKDLDDLIEKLNKKIENPKSFILPGKNKNSSILHVLRAKTRDLERDVVKLFKKRKKNEKLEMIGYLNRLSKFLFYLALREDKNKYLKVNYKLGKLTYE